MASLNMVLRRDDGSFLIMDMDLTDEDSHPLVTVMSDFISQHSDRLNQPAEAPQPVPVPTAPRPEAAQAESVPYNPMSSLIRSDDN